MEKLYQFADILTFGLVSFIFAVVKAVLSTEKVSISMHLLCVILSVVMGIIAGGVAKELGAGLYVAMTACSFVSLMSKDLVLGIIQNKGHIGQYVNQAITNLIDKWTK